MGKAETGEVMGGTQDHMHGGKCPESGLMVSAAERIGNAEGGLAIHTADVVELRDGRGIHLPGTTFRGILPCPHVPW